MIINDRMSLQYFVLFFEKQNSEYDILFLLEDDIKYSLKQINGEVEHLGILKKKWECRKLSTLRKTEWEMNGCIKIHHAPSPGSSAPIR
jgi:hypothetical protein